MWISCLQIPDDYIFNVLQEEDNFNTKPTAKVVWTGGKPSVSYFTKNKKGRSFEMAALTFHDKKESFEIQTSQEQAKWLTGFLEKSAIGTQGITTFLQAKQSYEDSVLEDFELLWYSKPINTLREFGLLVL